MKRLIGIFLAFCMLLAMVPMLTLAAQEYGVSVVDADGECVDITDANREDVLGDGTVSFEYDEENEKGILTLNGARLVSEWESPINAPEMGTLEIVLIGENYAESTWGTCIVANELIFSGSGSIDVVTEGFYNWCADCYDGITVNGGKVRMSSVNYAACLDSTLTVNAGELTLIATDETDGKALDVYGDPDVRIADGMTLLTGHDPSGADAVETDVSDLEALKTASYIRIYTKTAPTVESRSYTIDTITGANGSISPSGKVVVWEGSDRSFTVSPNSGYAVADVKIDGKSIGAVTSYTFKNISSDHTIEVSFTEGTGNPQTGAFEGYPGGIGIRAGVHTTFSAL